MKRRLRIFLAHCHCEFYLLTRGMWLGQSKLTGHDQFGKTLVICAVTGSMFDNTIQVRRVFYTEGIFKV